VEPLLRELASTADSSVTVDERLTLLLADFLACATAMPDPSAGKRPLDAGATGTAADLAIRSSLRDLDDVDWSSLHHPGSVIWPVVVALAGHTESAPEDIARAARAGYRTSATIADALGTAHRRSWHITATAGAMGAASAASVLLGLAPEGHARALALAAANLGGLATAARERRGAGVFNRAAAVTLGITAARCAAAGLVAVDHPLTGAGGVHEVMTGASAPSRSVIRDGVAEVGVRVYPVCGFLQSAAASVAHLRTGLNGPLVSMEVTVAGGTVELLDDAAGPWWDARLSLARVWRAGSPWAAATPCEGDSDAALVDVRGGALAPGASHVSIVTRDGSATSDGTSPPSVEDPGIRSLLRDKWALVLAIDPDGPEDMAHKVLTGTDPAAVLRALVKDVEGPLSA
jgi:hypothetical protein